MTEQEQQIAIAEACGWKQLPCKAWHGVKISHAEHPPDYLHDLNAMHEAEKTITDDLLMERNLEELATVVEGKTCYKLSEASPYSFAFATAAQRAEAFLRTIGKWKD